MSALQYFTSPKVTLTKEQKKQEISIKSKSEKQLQEIDKWISFCNFGVGFLDVGTNGLKNLGVLDNRGRIFELKNEFKQLESFYDNSVDFKTDRNELEDFFYTFINSTPEQRKRVVNFQKSINK